MIEYIRIKNLALIEDAELDFAPGLNTLTGETGAGKSFILRALGFLTGDKLDASAVRTGADTATVEAIFLLPATADEIADQATDQAMDASGHVEYVIRREIVAATGRSRVFINDRLASIEAIRALAPRMVLITSQHASTRLQSSRYQTAVIDGFLPDKSVLERRDQTLERLRAVRAERAALDTRIAEVTSQREFLEHQLDEIRAVDPQPGEEDELLAAQARFKSMARFRDACDDALGALLGDESLPSALASLGARVRDVAAVDDDFVEDVERIGSMRVELEDLGERLRHAARDATDGDPDKVQQRLFAFSALKRKMGRGADELAAWADELEARLSEADAAGLEVKRLEREEATARTALDDALTRLATGRTQAAQAFCTAMAGSLAGLGFHEAVRVEVAFEEHPLDVGGSAPAHADSADTAPPCEARPRLLWVPNPGQPPRPLSAIASGGELSRFLLALVGLDEHGTQLPTLVFDEIDAGIGGVTLDAVGARMCELATSRQVLVITHWPQIASRAEGHIRVEKSVEEGQTYTRCTRLQGDAIRAELVRMAGGGSSGEALAKTLLPPAHCAAKPS